MGDDEVISRVRASFEPVELTPHDAAPYYPPRVGASEPLDPQALAATIKRHWRLLLAPVLVCAIAALALNALWPPTYTASAKVMLDARQRQVIPNGQVLSSLSNPEAGGVIESEVQVITSRNMARQVVADLGLEKKAEFNPALRPPSTLDRAQEAVWRLLGRTPHQETSSPEAAREMVVDHVLSQLAVHREGDTLAISIRYSALSPQTAADVANQFSQRYLQSQLDAKLAASDRANKFLSENIHDLRGEVTSAERSVASYEAASGLIAATGASLTEQRVSELLKMENGVRADYAERVARLETARRQLAAGGTGEFLGEALNSPLVQNLRSKLSEVTQRESELGTRYGARHPELLEVQNERAALERSIREELQRIVGGLESEVNASRQRLASITASVGAARASLVQSKAAQVGLNDRNRDAAAKRSLYESYLERFQQTSSQAALAESDAQIISRAEPPLGPSAPRPKLNLAVGLALGLLIGAGMVGCAETFSTGLRTAEDIDRKLGEVSIGSIPSIPASVIARGVSPPTYLLQKPLSSFAESFRTVRVSLQRIKAPGGVKVIAITSSLPDEGKTTTAFCLMRSLATSNFHTVLIDCDLRRKAVSELAGRRAEVGLLEVLSGEARLADALMRDEASGAWILPLSARDQGAVNAFDSAAMTALLERLRREFDYVVLDCAPILPIADGRILAPQADAVLFLVKWRHTPIKAAQQALTILHDGAAKIAGVALAQVDLRAQAKHGYGDASYYHKQFTKYYVE